MLKVKYMIVLTVILCMSAVVTADDYIGFIQDGNKAFTESDYITASDFYHKAEQELPESPEIEYNIGGAMYKQGKYEEAVERYTKALNTTDLNLEGQAHYNLGNTYYRMGDYQNAIKSYENSLKVNPEDINAKFNLELARKMLKEQIKPEQQDQDQQQQQKEQEQKQEEEQEKNEEQQQQDQASAGSTRSGTTRAAATATATKR